jgi:hypothetical protein
LQDFEYWGRLTANPTLDRMPSTYGEDPAWDNAVVNPRAAPSAPSERFIGCWPGERPRTDEDCCRSDCGCWQEANLHDLERDDSGIGERVLRIEIMHFGLATVRPVVNFSQERRDLKNRNDRLLFANSEVILARNVVRQNVPVQNCRPFVRFKVRTERASVTPFDSFLPRCPTAFRPPALAAANFRGARPILHCKLSLNKFLPDAEREPSRVPVCGRSGKDFSQRLATSASHRARIG